jgi:ABC-2 type transport system ATP-binding protein
VDAVVVEDLRKSYGATRAVAGVSFTVRYGEIFSLLGPNGAGKTTVLEILEGYRQADQGKVVVAGFDPGDKRTGRQLREQIGLVLQELAVEPYLTVRESISRNAGYYPNPCDVGEVIGLVGLAGKERSKVKSLSGGQKRRLDLALGIIGNPRVLFLDEPTTGFDPSARRGAWEVIRGCPASAPRSCSPPTTWTRRRSSPTGSPSSPPARSSKRERPPRSAGATWPARGSASPPRGVFRGGPSCHGRG